MHRSKERYGKILPDCKYATRLFQSQNGDFSAPPGGRDTLNVIDLLSELARASECLENNSRPLLREMCLEFMQDGTIPSFEKPVWKALYEFYRRAWFKRLWTVQEEILAQCQGYWFGQHIFGNELVHAGIKWMQHYQPESFLSVDCEVDPFARSTSTVCCRARR